MPYICFNIHLRSLESSNGIFLYFYFSDGWPGVGEGRANEEWICALFCACICVTEVSGYVLAKISMSCKEKNMLSLRFPQKHLHGFFWLSAFCYIMVPCIRAGEAYFLMVNLLQ